MNNKNVFDARFISQFIVLALLHWALRLTMFENEIRRHRKSRKRI